MKSRGTVLIVDDEPYVRDSIATVLRRAQYTVQSAAGTREAVQPSTLEGLDAVITDLRMPGEDGLALLRKLTETSAGLPVIVLTGHGTVPSAVECMKAGAYDYLLKPVRPEVLELVLERALRESTMRRELDYLRLRGGRGPAPRPPIGVSAGWRHVVEMIELAAATDTTVLLLGESGTGGTELLINHFPCRIGNQTSRVIGFDLVIHQRINQELLTHVLKEILGLPLNLWV